MEDGVDLRGAAGVVGGGGGGGGVVCGQGGAGDAEFAVAILPAQGGEQVGDAEPVGEGGAGGQEGDRILRRPQRVDRRQLQVERGPVLDLDDARKGFDGGRGRELAQGARAKRVARWLVGLDDGLEPGAFRGRGFQRLQVAPARRDEGVRLEGEGEGAEGVQKSFFRKIPKSARICSLNTFFRNPATLGH